MKKKKYHDLKIFIDFDDAMFNTKSFIKELIKVFNKHGVSEKKFRETYKAYKTVVRKGLKLYDPKKQINLLEKLYGINGKQLEKDVYNFLYDTSAFILKDVEPFLKKLKKKNLYLISYGDNFSKKKIGATGLTKYFTKIKVTDKLKSHEIGIIFGKDKRTPFVFIDDRIDQIDAVKKRFPQSITFFVKRRIGRYNDMKSHHADHQVKNFKEIEKILRTKM